MKGSARQSFLFFALIFLILALTAAGAYAVPARARQTASSPTQQTSSSSTPQQPPATSQQAQPAPSQNSSQAPPPSLERRPAPAPEISPEEKQAFLAIEKEVDPDKQLQMVKDFEKKYPQSPFLSDTYFFGASASEQKNDVADALSYGEKSLKLRPDNLRSLILVASLLPLPQALGGKSPQQKSQQLDQSETDASHALTLLPQLQPPPNLPPEKFGEAKAVIQAQLHAALGMAHLEKAILEKGPPNATELSAAEQEFKAAVASPQPNAQDYYRLGEVYARENKLSDSIDAFTHASQLGQGSLIQKYADNMIRQLKAQQAKAQQQPQPGSPSQAQPQSAPQSPAPKKQKTSPQASALKAGSLPVASLFAMVRSC